MKRVLWLPLASLFLWFGTARAEGDDALEKAKALYAQGMAAFNQGRFSKAAASILSARDILRSRLRSIREPALKKRLRRAVRAAEFNLAIIYYKMGRPIQSVTYLRYFLKGASAKERGEIPAEVLAQQTKVGVLTVSAPGEDATIWIEGRYVGRGRVELVTPPGTLRVAIKVNGKTVAKKSIAVLPGTHPIWELATLLPGGGVASVGSASQGRGAPSPPRTSANVVTSSSGAQKRGGGRVSVGQSDTRRSRKLHWAYFTAAVGLVAALGAATIYTGVETLKVKSDYDEAVSGTKEKDDLKAKGIRYKTATNALIGVTAAVAAGALALGLFTEWKSPRKEKNSASSWRFLPAVGPRGAMLTFEWSH